MRLRTDLKQLWRGRGINTETSTISINLHASGKQRRGRDDPTRAGVSPAAWLCKARLPRTLEKAPGPGEWPAPRRSPVVPSHPPPARVRAPSPPSTAWAGLAKPTLHWTSGRDPRGRASSKAGVGTRPSHWLEITKGGTGAWRPLGPRAGFEVKPHGQGRGGFRGPEPSCMEWKRGCVVLRGGGDPLPQGVVKCPGLELKAAAGCGEIQPEHPVWWSGALL